MAAIGSTLVAGVAFAWLAGCGGSKVGEQKVRQNDEAAKAQPEESCDFRAARADRVVRSLSAQQNLSEMFKRMFRCDFDDEYVITSGESWLDLPL